MHLDNLPDRPLDPEEGQEIHECRDCGVDVLDEECRGGRCFDCWYQWRREDLRRTDLCDVIEDITRSLDDFGQISLAKKQA